jgi:hypothetical protein
MPGANGAVRIALPAQPGRRVLGVPCKSRAKEIGAHN